MISIDALRNGLELKDDLVLPDRPKNPEMRESTSIWMFDETGKFGFPRMGIEAEATSWDNRRLQGNFAFADGRVLNGAAVGPAPSAIGKDGRPTVLGAGPITFHCVEPFRRWTMTFDGSVLDTHVTNQIAKTVDPKRKIDVKLEADMTMAAPAWVQKHDDDSPEAGYMGIGYRFEQLFRAEGVFTVDGKALPFKGTGLRIHRQSIRRLEGFIGHCWQSAVFPDGRAFGFIAYPNRPDGSESYNEAFVYRNGRMHMGKVTKAPWLRRIKPRGDDVSCEIETDLGITRIVGTTELSTFRIANPDMPGLNLQQSGALYRWDGESAYGMIERSSKAELTSFDR